MKRKSRRRRSRSCREVELRFGYRVDVSDEDGLNHLFQAILGETIRVADLLGAVAEMGWPGVYAECEQEIHYVAGQLRVLGSSIDLDLLLQEFPAFWDDLSEKLRE